MSETAPRFGLRRAGPDDAPAIRTLTRAAYAGWVPIVGREPLPMTVDYAVAVIAHRIDLFEQDGQLLALVETAETPDHLLIVNLAVAPGSQGRGHGRALLRHAETVARQSGLAELRLYTNALMTANIALYQRLGYAEYLREQRAPGWEVVHMRKMLD
ncbi:MAG: GNAT family N-acetyltransferase [Alphaproteobacteria bacterium]|nr:GNAT family N-acetyltransferase [Alphaproteobacteria bacterium]